MQKPPKSSESRGIKSVEIGYKVLLAVQRGPEAVQLSDIAKRTGLSTGAAHNYIASLVKTGLVEQEGRGLYRLGPSAFALSLTSFRQLNGYDIVRSEAQALQQITGRTVAVSVWSQGGPVSILVQRSDDLGPIDFRPGLVPFLQSGVGMVFAAYLPAELIQELIESEIDEKSPWPTADRFIEFSRQSVLPRGYAHFKRQAPNYDAFSAPIWTSDNRIAFVISIVALAEIGAEDKPLTGTLLESARRASLFLGGTATVGPQAAFPPHG